MTQQSTEPGKWIAAILLILVFGSAKAQKYTPPPYWTVWFTTTSCEDGYDYQSSYQWVQSYDDSAKAYKYYHSLRSTGKVKVWNKMKCVVDTTSVYIDRYDMLKRKYDHS